MASRQVGPACRLPVSPERIRVISAKVWASMLAGAGFGLAAGAVAVDASTAALRARGITIHLDGGGRRHHRIADNQPPRRHLIELKVPEPT